MHAVGRERAAYLGGERVPVESDIEADLGGALVQTIEVLVQEQQHAVVQPQSFPHPVADHETAVEDRHFGRLALDEPAIEADFAAALRGSAAKSWLPGIRMRSQAGAQAAKLSIATQRAPRLRALARG